MKTTERGLVNSLCQDWTQIIVISSKHIFSPHLSSTVKYEEIRMTKSRRTRDRHFRECREQQRRASKTASQKKGHINTSNYIFSFIFLYLSGMILRFSMLCSKQRYDYPDHSLFCYSFLPIL